LAGPHVFQRCGLVVVFWIRIGLGQWILIREGKENVTKKRKKIRSLIHRRDLWTRVLGLDVFHRGQRRNIDTVPVTFLDPKMFNRNIVKAFLDPKMFNVFDYKLLVKKPWSG
jgi:hypothetical protein